MVDNAHILRLVTGDPFIQHADVSIASEANQERHCPLR
jgi:hypothetical protein